MKTTHMETDGHSPSHKHTSWPDIFQYSVYKKVY